ncbi:MAG TPA: cytidylate kinase-like family protein [Bryobacteraceae bacterium]|nr:cytidylate kinase-like family protein [Bryobacteraceae bacterium]
MIRIITIEREFGSGGAAIAQKLSERLGWKLWDQSLTGEIARITKADPAAVERKEERCDPLFFRLMKVFLRGSFERSLPISNLEMLDADRMTELMHNVINEAADAGNCVIVGRGSPYFLRERPDAFHVFVYAPYDEKIRRVRASGKSEREAAELVDTIDRERAAFIKRYFRKEWPNRHLYHMMINSIVGDEAVLEMILNEVTILNRQPALV